MVALAGFFFYLQIKRATEITVDKVETPLISANTTFIPDSASEQMIGNPGATTTITEFVDIGCSRCLALHSATKKFVLQHPQAMRLIWKDYVKPGFLSDYTLAHQAAYCAGQQGKFWEFIDIAIGNKNNLGEPGLKKIAQSLNLDLAKWWQCANSSAAKEAITASTQAATQLGVKSIPAIFVNNKLINTRKDIDIAEMLGSFIGQ